MCQFLAGHLSQLWCVDLTLSKVCVNLAFPWESVTFPRESVTFPRESHIKYREVGVLESNVPTIPTNNNATRVDAARHMS